MDISSLVTNASRLGVIQSTFGTPTTSAIPGMPTSTAPAQPQSASDLAGLLSSAYQVQTNATALQQLDPSAAAATDPSAASGIAQSFAGAYNSLWSTLTSNQNLASLAPSVMATLQQAFGSQSDALKSIGVSGSAGSVSVDPTAFANSLQQDPQTVLQLLQQPGGLVDTSAGVSQQLASTLLGGLGSTDGGLPASLYGSAGSYDMLGSMSADALKGSLLDKVI